MSKATSLISLVFSIFLLGNTPLFAASVESTFSGGTEGWTIVDNGDNAPPVARNGAIHGKEDEGDIDWFYVAPAKFLGDKSGFHGGTISFYLAQAQTDSQFDAPDIRLIGANMTLTADAGSNPGKAWTRYDVALNLAGNWHNSTQDRTATEADLKRVLQNLAALQIRGEFRIGEDASSLDTVVLSDTKPLLPTLSTQLADLNRIAGPPDPGKTHANLTDEEIALFMKNLGTFNLTDGELKVLIAHVMGEGQSFDIKKAGQLLAAAKRLRVTDAQKEQRGRIREFLEQSLNLPQQAIAYLENDFFHSSDLMNPARAEGYGADYQNYVAAALFGENKEFLALLNEQERNGLRSKFNYDIAGNSQPSIRSAPAGSGRIDCSFYAVLARMRQADPTFAIKWDVYVIYGSAVSLAGPGGAAGTSGSGAAIKRAVLIAGVRQAIKDCERSR